MASWHLKLHDHGLPFFDHAFLGASDGREHHPNMGSQREPVGTMN